MYIYDIIYCTQYTTNKYIKSRDKKIEKHCISEYALHSSTSHFINSKWFFI